MAVFVDVEAGGIVSVQLHRRIVEERLFLWLRLLVVL